MNSEIIELYKTIEKMKSVTHAQIDEMRRLRESINLLTDTILKLIESEECGNENNQ